MNLFILRRLIWKRSLSCAGVPGLVYCRFEAGAMLNCRWIARLAVRRDGNPQGADAKLRFMSQHGYEAGAVHCAGVSVGCQSGDTPLNREGFRFKPWVPLGVVACEFVSVRPTK